MLVSGSIYVYALYAPSFTGSLGYSQTQTSLVSVIGDFGLYGVGPLNGIAADRFGPRITCTYAAILVALGYYLMSANYANGASRVEQGLPPPSFALMAFFFLLAGIGSSASYMAAFTSLAKNFKHSRGIALGIPIGFTGLSAAILTFIAQKFFTKIDSLGGDDTKGLDTARFLLFLALLGGCVNALAVVAMNIVPTPDTQPEHAERGRTPASHPPRVDEQAPLLGNGITEVSTQDVATVSTPTAIAPSVSGKAFFMDPNAQSFFLVIICLAGTGLMIINSISAIADAIAASELLDSSTGLGKHLVEASPVSSIRAVHVGLISISSYLGRVLAGFGSDIVIHRYGAYRIDVVPIASACVALAQLLGMFAPLRWLYMCSILTGLGYGALFGIAPTFVAETWGEETCGQNWGWLSWGAAIGGMVFNLLFGIVVDASRPIVDGEPQDCKGHHCFRGALVVSFAACALSCYMSLVIGKRQRRAAALIS